MHSYEEYKDLINSNIIKYIPAIAPEAAVLKESMEYSLRVGGKRIRPAFLLAACEFAGGDIDTAIPYACAIEFIHTYSLIHDDLPAMDNDDLRRGKPTNHKVYGEDIAILAGDGLLNSAAELMYAQAAHASNYNETMNHIKAGHEIMSRAGVCGMIGGQTADVVNENSQGTAELVRYIEEHKTGNLITAAILAGLHLGGASEEMLADFGIYAMNIGVAFQVLDDILDFEGDAKLLGKTLGKDIDQDKCNYVCVHGLDAAKDELHRLTEEALAIVSKYGDEANYFVEMARRLEIRKY